MFKEYLVLVDGKYELRRADVREFSEGHTKDWIEVPEGASVAYTIINDIFNGVVFYKKVNGVIMCHTKCNPDWRVIENQSMNYLNSDRVDFVKHWQRNKPETTEYLDPVDWSLKNVADDSVIPESWIKVPAGAIALTTYDSGYAGYWFNSENKYKGFGRVSDIGDFGTNDVSGESSIEEYANRCGATIVWTRYTQPEQLPFTNDETDYLLSSKANRDRLMQSIAEANKATDDLFKACFEYADKIKCSDPSKIKEMREESDTIKWAVDNSDKIAADKINNLTDDEGPHNHYFKDVSGINEIDVYQVLRLFNVTDPCLQHIVKKALCAGQRGHKDFETDLKNIFDTAKRALEINNVSHSQSNS